MADAKQYARKLLVVSLSDKGTDEKKNEETVKIDLVCIVMTKNMETAPSVISVI